MTKLGIKLGAKAETFSGLSGLGDLVLTASSPLSRNYLFGFLLAQGRGVEEALKEVGMVVEGVHTTSAALLLSKKYDVEMPIAKSVAAILKGKVSPAEAVELLMSRDIKEEHL
jgi:glycerol-3-phosphate dehydrogenase (NAD(P)+)